MLPLAGVSAGAVLQTRAQNLLAQVFRGPILGQALRRGFPVGRQQTDDRLAARIGADELVFPLHPGLETGAGIGVQKDLIGQRRILRDQPPPQRLRLAIVLAGMTHKDPRHRPATSPRRTSRTRQQWRTPSVVAHSPHTTRSCLAQLTDPKQHMCVSRPARRNQQLTSPSSPHQPEVLLGGGGVREQLSSLWIKIFYAASFVVVMSSGRSTSLPFSNIAPARTSATRWGALTARQRDWAASISL